MLPLLAALFLDLSAHDPATSNPIPAAVVDGCPGCDLTLVIYQGFWMGQGSQAVIDGVDITFVPGWGSHQGDCIGIQEPCDPMACRFGKGVFEIEVEPDKGADVYNQPGGDANHRAHIRGGILGTAQEFTVVSASGLPENLNCGSLKDLLQVFDMYDNQYEVGIRCTSCPEAPL